MHFNRNKKYTYQWRDDNDFKLYVDGENFFPYIFHLIDSAENFIVIEQYLVESGEITTQLIDHLVNAAKRGVSVFLLLDDYGSMDLNKDDRQRLAVKNIQLVFLRNILVNNINLADLICVFQRLVCISQNRCNVISIFTNKNHLSHHNWRYIQGKDKPFSANNIRDMACGCSGCAA